MRYLQRLSELTADFLKDLFRAIHDGFIIGTRNNTAVCHGDLDISGILVEDIAGAGTGVVGDDYCITGISKLADI